MMEFMILNAVLSTFMLDNLYISQSSLVPPSVFCCCYCKKACWRNPNPFWKRDTSERESQLRHDCLPDVFIWLSPLLSNRERHPGFREWHRPEICNQPSSRLQHKHLQPDLSYQHRDHHYHHRFWHGDRAEHPASTDAHTGTGLYPGPSVCILGPFENLTRSVPARFQTGQNRSFMFPIHSRQRILVSEHRFALYMTLHTYCVAKIT